MAEEKKKPAAKKPEVKKDELPELDLNELNRLHREGFAKRKKEAK